MTSQKESVHFIAIGGIGMSALAKILLSMGYNVSGSDVKESPLVDKLKELGAHISLGHNADNLPDDCNEVIYSSAIHEDNPELLKAKAMGIPITHRGDLLARFINSGKGLAVAGAHGKTTTSGMLSMILHAVEYHPNIVLGGILPCIDSNALKDDSDLWVVEADESDRSFLKLHPYLTVITNIEPEHMENYGTEENLKNAFLDFCNSSEKIIVCLDNNMVTEIAPNLNNGYYTYGLEHKAVDLTAREIKSKGLHTDSKIYYKGEYVAQLHLPIPGRHNVANALGAMYAAYIVGVPFGDSAAALRNFTGTGRRFDVLYDDKGVLLVDDYAHHPTEVEATITAAKCCGYDRVIAVFQPHRYSRVRDLYKEFGKSFGEADVIVIDEIYSAWENRIEGISSQLIVDEISQKGLKPLYLKGSDAIYDYLKENYAKGDLILMMGAGDIRKTTDRFCAYLKGED
ncbi:MAG: UDP-N-acetylmuramate--L-alanine ligase [Clostridiales bacterium]